MARKSVVTAADVIEFVQTILSRSETPARRSAAEATSFRRSTVRRRAGEALPSADRSTARTPFPLQALHTRRWAPHPPIS